MADGAIIVTVMVFLLALVLITATLYLITGVPRLLENTVLGLIALLVIDYFGKSAGFTIPLDWIAVLVSAIGGLAGVGLLIILNLLGIRT